MTISNPEISSLPVICGPSGIGDLSWMYSKLKNAGPMHWEVAEGWPPRSRDFLALLPGVASASFSMDFRYEDILQFEKIHGWILNKELKWSNIVSSGFGRYMLEANKHLEAGHRLETWLPDLPCDFHYEIPIGPDAMAKADALLEGLERPICLVNCASDRGAEAWKTWRLPEWLKYLELLKGEIGPNNICLIGGFWDDLTSSVAELGHYRDIVGRTSIEVMIALLKKADLYVGFSSGLGILRTVLDKKAFMMWPEFQILLSRSWAPPEMLENGTYVASLWRDPELVFGNTRRWIRR